MIPQYETNSDIIKENGKLLNLKSLGLVEFLLEMHHLEKIYYI